SCITGGGSEMSSASLLVSETKSPAAHEIFSGTWINSEALTLKGLRGRVVVVEFWTLGCYNCRNTLPSVKSWDAHYREKGFKVTNCDLKESASILLSWIMKSDGKRSRFRLTAWFRTLVSTP